MSTFAYAAITSARDAATPGTSTKQGSPGVATYVDALAALVPAEVLTAHAAILTFTTDTVTTSGKPVVTVSDPGTLQIVFWALTLLSVVVYVFGRWMAKKWDGYDWLRMLIPAAAFVGWTMLQKATAFDALNCTWITPGMRNVIPIIGAIVLGLITSVLAYRADAQAP
jgi:hypothetical protein